jgi:hypothetical protein
LSEKKGTVRWEEASEEMGRGRRREEKGGLGNKEHKKERKGERERRKREWDVEVLLGNEMGGSASEWY